MTSLARLSRDAEMHTIEDQARDWVIRLTEEPAAEADCAAWRALDPAHDAAFRDVIRIWSLATSLGPVIGENWREEAEAISVSPVVRIRDWALRGAGRVVLPLAAAASLVAAIVVPQMIEPDGTEVQTAIAQTEILRLDDGSRVTLGARSIGQIQYASNERRFVLDEGQAFFEVAHDPSRPFVVLAGNAEITVTGTRFDVRRVGDDVQISVLDGRVELRRRPLVALLRSETPVRVLVAGQRSELEDGDTFTVETRAPIRAGEWRTGRLYYSEAPLSEIIADMQRYSRVPIRIANVEVGELRVTTSFSSDDIAQFLANLEAALPIDSRQANDGSIILTAR